MLFVPAPTATTIFPYEAVWPVPTPYTCVFPTLTPLILATMSLDRRILGSASGILCFFCLFRAVVDTCESIFTTAVILSSMTRPFMVIAGLILLSPLV